MLPRVAKPVAYDLQLTIIPENARFSGHAVIDIDLSTPADMLWINGKDPQRLSNRGTLRGRRFHRPLQPGGPKRGCPDRL